MMTNKEIIKNILIEEFSKFNNVNYRFDFGSLTIKVNTKRLFPQLVNQCDFFEGGINSEWRFDYRKNSYFWLSYDYIWSKIEKESGLKYDETQSLVKNILEEGFNLKGITPRCLRWYRYSNLEEGFNLKGITPRCLRWYRYSNLEEGFNLKGITPGSGRVLATNLLEEGFNLKNISSIKI